MMSGSKQELTFHVFPPGTHDWSAVTPGDVVVCPGTYAYRLEDFSNVDENTRGLILQQRPLLVLSVTMMSENSGLASDGDVVFTVLSRHGILCILRLFYQK
jgi:hypothetical protein